MEFPGHMTGTVIRTLVLLPLLALQVGLIRSQLHIPYDWIETECPDVDTKMMVNQARVNVPWGVPGRAYLTLPQGLEIAPSKIKGAGFGVLSNTFIPKFTWLGEHEGEIVPRENSRNISLYAWQVRRNLSMVAYIDGYHLHLSSYHRYMNNPVRHTDENVISLECYGKIFYMTNKGVAPGTELLVFYGPWYAKRKLKIDLNEYYETSPELLAAGLNLNNFTHLKWLNELGFEFYEMRNPPLSFLPMFFSKLSAHH